MTHVCRLVFSPPTRPVPTLDRPSADLQTFVIYNFKPLDQGAVRAELPKHFGKHPLDPFDPSHNHPPDCSDRPLTRIGVGALTMTLSKPPTDVADAYAADGANDTFLTVTPPRTLSKKEEDQLITAVRDTTRAVGATSCKSGTQSSILRRVGSWLIVV